MISTRVHNGVKSHHIGNLQKFFICKILSNMYTIYSTVELEKMSSDDIEPYDWYRRFLGRGRWGFLEDVFRGF